MFAIYAFLRQLFEFLLVSFKFRSNFIGIINKGMRTCVLAIHLSTVTDFIQQQLQLFHFEFHCVLLLDILRGLFC